MIRKDSYQAWQKQGQIYTKYAQIPTVFQLDEETWRIFFSERTPDNKSYIRFIDVEAGNPTKIIFESEKPLLPFGPLGAFDYSGAMPSCALRNPKAPNEVFLYYIGWAVRKDVPYANAIGLAISYNNGLDFVKYSDGPILSTDISDPYFTGTSCVNFKDGYFRIWYMTCTEWKVYQDKPEPRYRLKYRYSEDGIKWSAPCDSIRYKNKQEGGVARASILDDAQNQMWYCYRGWKDYRTDKNESYKVGYAEQNDKGTWVRKDELVGLELSKDGFDSEMLCYPNIIKHQNHYYLFYNGNGFGATGIGYATLEAY